MAEPLLDIRGLEVRYAGLALGVGTVDLAVYPNEVFGLVGESGSGKTTLGMSVLGGLPASARIVRGSIGFRGRDLVTASRAEWRRTRWRELAYVPQGAMNALNPVARVRRQFADLVRDHTGQKLKGEWLARAERALAAVRLDSDVLGCFPHELSGGMKQRVCIAMAILFDPKLIIADESTSALDVVSQRVVLQTMLRVKAEFGTSIVLIGHDLALQAQAADRIGIMFGGHLVEIGPATDIFDNPHHPYTQRLIASVPSIKRRAEIPDAGLPTDAERESWLREDVPLVEVSPGHLMRPVDGQA
jgi:ABC-type dipeptide/oligopeptide/nickel transport system ATPase component